VPVLKVSALQTRPGIEAFWADIERYRNTMQASGELVGAAPAAGTGLDVDPDRQRTAQPLRTQRWREAALPEKVSRCVSGTGVMPPAALQAHRLLQHHSCESN
jgi:putative protein kinase ArgK-like GTPase of G3E family